MKYSVFTVVMGDSRCDQVARELKQLGYDGVEWRVHADYHIRPEDVLARAEEIRLLSEASGLEIPVLATYFDPTDVEGVKNAMQAARIMGCPAVRIRSALYTPGTHYDRALKEAIESLKRVERLSEETGVKAVLEIHSGTIISSASAAYRLVSHFDPRNVGTIFDPANMIIEGRENWRMGLEILGKYMAHVHVKNLAWFPPDAKGGSAWQWRYTPLDEGMVDWNEVLAALNDVGYDGYLSVEDLYGSDAQTTGLIQESLASQETIKRVPTLEKLARDLEYLKCRVDFPIHRE